MYGPLLYALAADVKEAKGQFHGHDFSTRDWLILETKGADAYILSNRDDPHFSTERTEAIGRLVETRSYNQLAVGCDNWLITLPGYGQPPKTRLTIGPARSKAFPTESSSSATCSTASSRPTWQA